MKKTIGLAAALAVSACATQPAPASPLQTATDLCRTTLNNYFIGIDNHDWSILPKTFTEDTVVILRENTMTGLEELEAYFLAREPQPDIVHHLTTTKFEVTGANTASGIVYLLIQGHMDLPNGEKRRVFYSGQYADNYVISGGQCKISKRQLTDKYLHIFAME